MKRKVIGLEPLHVMTKSQASYEKLMLDMMSKLVTETRQNNRLIRQTFGRSDMPSRVMTTDNQNYQQKLEESPESIYARDSKSKTSKQSDKPFQGRNEESLQQVARIRKEQKMEKILQNLVERLSFGQEVNKRLLEQMQKMQTEKMAYQNKRQRINSPVQTATKSNLNENQLNLLEKAIADKFKNTGGETDGKKSSYILSEILPYSDRREIKVKFKLTEDMLSKAEQSNMENLKSETAEWLGQVYRATASICWNMLINNYLNFDEVKILFTENIVFNFVEFMQDLKKVKKQHLMGELTTLINKKSVSILDFLCRQYPQTKIEAPNLALRSILPQISKHGRSKYDLVCRSGISFTYREDGDYTDQIMRMINFMINQTNVEFDGFYKFMRESFEQIYLPINKRKKFVVGSSNELIKDPTQEDLVYREKVKQYSKYLIGRKIPKNTSLYTQQEIADGIFFVKSNAVLRIITKWVQQLMQYFQNPEKTIKNNYNQNKDHHGNIMFLSALLKNGIYHEILKEKEFFFQKVHNVRSQCQKMQYLLTAEEFTSDPSQVHLSQEQISVGMYCCNIKSVISSYLCSELNRLIHFLLKIPRQIQEDSLGNDLEVFQSQARKDLDSVNLITFKLFDLLRCKIHSNQQEIIWIVKFLLFESQNDRTRFKIVRIKDRLGLGTRDIMINAQINNGLVCEIQLSVTSNSDKKQELLDSYNHFLYELKRSSLGAIIQNVSIWSNLEQRYSYFEQLIAKRKRKGKMAKRGQLLRHKCGVTAFKISKRPLICKECNQFYPIPTTCLLNTVCLNCGVTFCGQCYYYNYLDMDERKEFIFDGHRLLKPDVMNRLVEYTDYSKPFPTPGFYLPKHFLTKQMSFYMAVQKVKTQQIEDAPHIEIIITQTVIRNDKIFNRQVNTHDIEARLQKKQFYIKDYEKTDLNNFIIFYFDKKENKKMMTLNDLKEELSKPENAKAKVLDILREPSYIPMLKPIKKQSDKLKELASLEKVIKDGKIVTYCFNQFFLLAQVMVKGTALRADIRKRVNLNELKDFAQQDADIVSMQYKGITTEMEDIVVKFKPLLYSTFCNNLRKLFLSNGQITSIKCFQNFKYLQTVFVNQNQLTSLEGIEQLQFLLVFTFDHNRVETLTPFANLEEMRFISGNANKIKNLKGLQNLKKLKNLSIYQNQIESIEELRNHQMLKDLYVRDNPITDLSVIQTIPRLQKLFIGKTKIKALPDISKLKELRVLSLENLNLDQIPNIFSTLSLTELSLSHNNIKEIVNLNNQSEMVSLNLSDNQITAIKNLDSLDKMETLKLNNNQITTIRGVKNLDTLKYLGIKNNPINDIGELFSFELTFKYLLTPETITENAKKQLAELEISKNTVSSSEN